MEPKLVEAFGFSGENHLWNGIILVLNDAVKDEVETAISRETNGEERTHAAGRAEALNDFLLLLNQLREKAKEINGSM
jgi:hypothetical protein